MSVPSAHLTRCTLLLLIACFLPGVARAQTEPVQFTLMGSITDGSAAPIDHARLIVRVDGTEQVLADQIFTASDGTFNATFQAEVIPTVDVDDPILPPGLSSEFWMGYAQPNPFIPGVATRLSLPYAAPSSVGAPPELQVFDSRGRRMHLGEQMASGVYFYRLKFDGRFTEARKFVLLGATRIQPELRRVAGPKAIDQPTGPAPRRAEGEAVVEITVLKPGYVTEVTSIVLNSRVDNQFAAGLDLAPVPTAALSIDGTLVEGEAVLFDGIGSMVSGDPGLLYSWDFGDGVRGGGELVAHVYAQAGTYDVALTVSSVHGATATATDQAMIAAAMPPATTDAVIAGTLRDALGNLLEGVTVSLVNGASTGDSDAQGSVTLTGLPTGVPIALLCEKPGYTRQVVRMVIPANTTTTEFRATLRSRGAAVVVAQIENGSNATGEDGVRLVLPAEALMRPDGTAATGAAQLRLTPVDMTNQVESGAFPGSYEGVLSTGERGLILSYGVAEFVIEQNGEHLQLQPGSTATVEIPVYTPGAALDDVIALWSVDETTGLWTEEGSGTVVVSEDSPTGLAMRAEVTHFSWWNSDRFTDGTYSPIPRCMIKDEDGLPTLQLPPGTNCYIEGQILGVGGPTTRPTILIPSDGGITLPLPAGVDVQLSASFNNGVKRGKVVVHGAAGETGPLIIGVGDLEGMPGHLDLPFDLESAIDPAGEVDTYTFDAVEGQYFIVLAEQSNGSTLEGELRVYAPDDTELFTGPFGDNPASFAHECEQTGTFRLEIDGTANEPGAYHLIGQWPQVFDAAPGNLVEGDMIPGTTWIVRVPLDAGEWFSVNNVRRELVGFGSIGTLDVRTPDGTLLFTRHFTGPAVDSGVLQAPVAGTYEVRLVSQDIQAACSLFIRSVPPIPIGGIAGGSAEENSTRYFHFNPAAGDFLRTTWDKVNNFTGSVALIGTNNQEVPGAFAFGQPDDSLPTAFNTAGDYFIRLTAGFTTVRSERDFRVSLNRILPPAPLTFDSAGRAVVNGGQIGTFGDVRLYEMTGTPGMGIAAELRAGDVTSLGTGATLKLLRIGNGSYRNPDGSVFSDFQLYDSGDLATGLLEYNAFVVSANDTYILAVSAPAPEDGEFDLIVDRLAPASTINVDNDLLDCPDADTRSLALAGLVAPPGATISVCAGDYSGTLSITLASPGVQLVGSSPQEVTVRMLGGGYAIYAPQTPGRIANLTVINEVNINSVGIYLGSAQGTVLEDLVISPTNFGLPRGIEIDRGSSGAILRRITINGCSRSIDAEMDDAVIEDCQFLGNASVLRLQGDGMTVQNNVWQCEETGTVLQIQSGAGHQILGNEVSISTSDIGAALLTYAMTIYDNDLTGSRPQTVVRGNRITTNEAGLELGIGGIQSTMLCEQNLVRMTAAGHTAVELLALSDTSPTAVIRNNVFDGTAYWRAVYLRWPEWYGSVDVVNNTVRAYTGGLGQADYPTILLELRSGSAFTGALPVTIANNVLQGPGASTGVEVPNGCTIDSDYNLLNGYATTYRLGSTSTGTHDLIEVDPQFAPGDLLELEAGSPGVDSGNPAAPNVPSVDYDGTARPQGSGIDRGAHER